MNLDKIQINKLSCLFESFTKETRIKILSSIYEKEKTVSEIEKQTKIKQNTISNQLKILRDNNVVKTRRDGRRIYYSFKDYHIREIFKMGIEHIKEENNEEKV